MMKTKKVVIVFFFFLAGLRSASSQVAQFPFSFNGKHIWFKLSYPERRSLDFIFDTGATNATIDSITAEKYGINKLQRKVISMGGSGGLGNYIMVNNQKLKVGGVEIDNVNLILVNFSSLSAHVNAKIDGIIGYEILKKYTTKLDFESKKILL